MNPFIKEKKQLSIFVTAGYPKINSLGEQLKTLEKKGVDFIEVGIPFSDPMADGPVIQQTSDIALKNGMTTSLMFEQLAEVTISIPLVIMSYFNPILRFGVEPFLEKCISVGVRHLIIPDLSLEIYASNYRELFIQFGVTLCFLVTPKTELARVERMAKYSSAGFIYLVSSNMTTGNSSSKTSTASYEAIRNTCGVTSMMIGFGIRNRTDVHRVHKYSDGAIIGSAYLQALEGRDEAAFLEALLRE